MSDSCISFFVLTLLLHSEKKVYQHHQKKDLLTFLQHQLEIQLSTLSKIQHLFLSKLGLSSLNLGPLIKSFLNKNKNYYIFMVNYLYLPEKIPNLDP